MTLQTVDTTHLNQVENSEKTIVFVDVENVGKTIEQIYSKIDDYSLVILCHAKEDFQVPFQFVSIVAEALKRKRLQVVKLSTRGKNAADR